MINSNATAVLPEKQAVEAIITSPKSLELLPGANSTSINELSQLKIKEYQQQKQRISSSMRSSRSRSRSGRSITSVVSTITPNHHVVYSTGSKYDHWILSFLSIPLILILFQMTASSISATKADFERSGTVWIMGWTLILILGLYMSVLPKQVDVRSNGIIGIKTFLVTYQFGDICHAYLAGLGPDSNHSTTTTASSWLAFIGVPCRYKFSTCLDSADQVVIRRRGGQWDLVVSPENANEFLRTLQSLITKLEIQKCSEEPGYINEEGRNGIFRPAENNIPAI